MGPCAWRLDFQRVHVSTMSSSAFFAYGALLTLASGTVYVGSLASLRTPEATKALRKEKGLKVKDIALFMGFLEPQAVYKWQQGKALPSLDNMFALSVLLEVPMEEILVRKSGDSLEKDKHLAA